MEGLTAVNIATVTLIFCSLAGFLAAFAYQWLHRDPIDELLHRIRKRDR